MHLVTESAKRAIANGKSTPEFTLVCLGNLQSNVNTKYKYWSQIYCVLMVGQMAKQHLVKDLYNRSRCNFRHLPLLRSPPISGAQTEVNSKLTTCFFSLKVMAFLPLYKTAMFPCAL